MKKIFSTLLVFVLVLTSVFAFTGCKSDQDAIVGSWKADINFGKMFDKIITQSVGELPIGDLPSFGELSLAIRFDFNEDGTCKMYADADDNKDFVDDFKDSMRTVMKAMLDEQAKSLGMTADQILAMQNMTMDDLLDEAFASFNTESLFSEFKEEGTYRLEDGKLFLKSDDADEEEDEYMTYELDGDTLKITGSSEADKDSDSAETQMLKEIFPMEFKRQ